MSTLPSHLPLAALFTVPLLRQLHSNFSSDLKYISLAQQSKSVPILCISLPLYHSVMYPHVLSSYTWSVDTPSSFINMNVFKVEIKEEVYLIFFSLMVSDMLFLSERQAHILVKSTL